MLPPVVERELLVASRQRMTFYWRMLSAGILLPIFGALYRLQQQHPGFGGPQLLFVLSVFVFVEAMLAGVRFTSDCLSEERREGTLGLLFLTDLGGLDIVLGKVAARALRAFFNILATFPILALPLFVGGVTGQQVAAVCLMLVVCMFFSLSVGTYVSSRGLRERDVLLRTLLLLVWLAFGPLAINEIAIRLFSFYRFSDTLVHLSPYHAFIHAQRGFSPQLLPTLYTLCAASVVLLGYAAWRIRHNFGEPPAVEATTPQIVRLPARRLAGFIGSPLDWLARQGRVGRRRLIASCVLILLFGAFCKLAIADNWNWAIPIVFIGSYGVHLAFKFFIVAETCRQLNEDRRSGALELLLVTPVKTVHLVRAQLTATWRAWAPVAICVALMNYLWLSDREFKNEDVFQAALPLSIILLFSDTIVLPWRAVLESLKGDRYPTTVFKTFVRSMGPPLALIAFLIALAIGSASERTAAMLFQAWACACVLFNVILVADARTQLKRFRLLASGEKLTRPWALRPRPLAPRRFPLPIPARRM